MTARHPAACWPWRGASLSKLRRKADQTSSVANDIAHTNKTSDMLNFPENLGLATDLLLHAETGILGSTDDYIVVRTPEAPEYFFGNMLVLRNRPSGSDLCRLENDFAQLIGIPPLIGHRAFAWSETDEGATDLGAFVEQGYDATICRVLTARPNLIRPVATNGAVEVREFRLQRDWDDWAAMQLVDMPDPSDIASQRYIAHQQAAYRRLIARGLGQWWGAFFDEEQVGSLGLFFHGSTGRFQSVITSERHRNQGVCRTLVREVIRLTAGCSDRVVMVADESYHAGKIYEALGFEQHGRVGSLCREPA